jgi:methionyl-tRNA formyltransferase
MYFIGSGALLSHAADYCRTAGIDVEGVCCPPQDPSTRRLRDRGIDVLESGDPNCDAPAMIEKSDGVVFSINNRFILSDTLLERAKFFNIHNGLIQRYRGIAEVCIFAALCRGDEDYGVTLHRLLPRQPLDTGPVVAQLRFSVDRLDGFSDVLQKSLQACRSVFESNIQAILDKSYTPFTVETAGAALTYKDVPLLCSNSAIGRLARASDLGRYAGFLPKLKSSIDAARATL